MDLSIAVIKNLKADSSFNAFLDYVKSKIDEIDTVRDLEDFTLSNERAGEEAKVRSLAVSKLYEIFRPIVDYTERQAVTDDLKQAKKAKFGL